MTIREELKETGFTDEKINEFVAKEYLRRKQILEYEKRRLLEKKHELKLNLIERYVIGMIHKLAYKKLLNERKNNAETEKIDLETCSAVEAYEYYSRHNINPTESIENEDGTVTHIYKQKNREIKVNIKVNLIGIPSPSQKEMEKFEIDQKRLLAELLPVSEDEIVDMSDEQVLKLIKDNEKNIKIIYN